MKNIFFCMKKEGKEKAPFAKAMAILIGTTVGAGIFGIPYVVAKAGFLIGLIHLLVLGAIVLLINLFTGEIALRTKKRHMLAGYAEKYLGKTGKTVMALTAIFGIFGALIAYLIGEGEVLSAIFGNNPMIFSIGFFVIASAIIWFDLRAVAGSELLLSGIMLAIIIIISALALPNVDLDNLKTFDIGKFFLPYGVVLFAFVGASAVPEMKGVLKQEKKMLRNAIVFGTIIPFVIYLIFTFVVVGITGIGTTEVATVGLGEALGKYMVFLGNIFAVFAMATSFIVLGLVTAIGCAPPQTPAEGPKKGIKCNSRENCYFKALVDSCICEAQSGQPCPHGTDEASCIVSAYRKIRNECQVSPVGMGDLCGEPSPPTPPKPKPEMRIIQLNYGDEYRQALFEECMKDKAISQKHECVIQVHRQIRKECAENPKGMGELCSSTPSPQPVKEKDTTFSTQY